MENMIETKQLTKFYQPDSRGIEDLNLVVKTGEIFGFLGPNGAGKTTTIRILLDFIRLSSGTAKVMGLDVHKESLALKKRVGYLPSEFSLYPHLTVEKCLKYFSQFVNKELCLKNIPLLAERFQLKLNEKIKSLSHGNKQKVGIVMAFMKEPELFILDEPTQGLDPLMQEEFYRLLKEQQKVGKTIFLSSHILTEVEKICQRCGVIKEGKLIEIEEVHKLKEKKLKKIFVRFSQNTPKEDFSSLPQVQQITEEKGYLKILAKGNMNPLIAKLSQHPIEDITIQDPTLEDIFLEYYK